ncbi:hypothetical protein [Paenibacillus chitinolyticus]
MIKKPKLFKSLSLGIALLFCIESPALAVNQNPNATVYLGSYSDYKSYSIFDGWPSKECKATLNTMKLTVSNDKANVGFRVHWKKNDADLWTSDGGRPTYLEGRESASVTINTTVGYLYRVWVQTTPDGSPASGAAYCE